MNLFQSFCVQFTKKIPLWKSCQNTTQRKVCKCWRNQCFSMELFLLYDTVISSGEMRSLPTNCTISPYHDWFLWTIGNPAVTLIFHEEYITPLQHSFRLHVSVTNTSGESKHLPAGLCIGYLLLRCNWFNMMLFVWFTSTIKTHYCMNVNTLFDTQIKLVAKQNKFDAIDDVSVIVFLHR